MYAIRSYYVFLCIVERSRTRNLRGDASCVRRVERGLIACARGLRSLELTLVAAIDRRAVLGTDVVALTHALRRVMPFPEHAQQRIKARNNFV